MKKLLSLALALFMLCMLTACQTTPTETRPHIAETIPLMTTPTETSTPVIETEPVETVPPTTVPPETEPPEFTISMSFVGDIMLAKDRSHGYDGSFVNYADTKDPTYFLEKVVAVFEADDFTIGNLENVLSDRDLSRREKSGSRVFWYKSPTRYTDILTSSSVEGVSIANNHTFDYGQGGYNDTRKALENAGLEYGYNDKTMYFEKEGFKIAVICHGLWYEGQEEEIIKRIHEAEKESDFQIVFYHGGTEKVHAPDKWKVRASRRIAENGADLVLGNHPHVLQPRENHNGVEIVYSLGNFCYGGNKSPKNRTMIYQVNLTIDKMTMTVKNYDSNIIPCYVYTGSINNFQPAIIEDEAEKQRVLDFMNGSLDLPY